ncbi:hypothetical protein B9Z19DRAFT_972648 [Tuber borchii]|uniref:Secreted protein n=1 Tax=Tuber borchii TaxID=42251 RepID=A0A2T7A061_TUBBO|nr:hypothetical protein B9Z19DRAFT_972648 [Tuber borchii]
MPWLVLLISGGTWVALREHWFHWTQQPGCGLIVRNLPLSFRRSCIGSSAIPIQILCCLVSHYSYTRSDSLLVLGKLADWWIP